MELEKKAAGVRGVNDVYAPDKFRDRVELRTRAYAVAAGQRVTDTWEIAGFEGGVYHLRVSGPNGFFREFAGSERDPPIDIRCQYLRTGDVQLHASSRLHVPSTLNVTDFSYKSGNHSMLLGAGASRSMVLHLGRSHQWYDFGVTIAGGPVSPPLCGPRRNRESRFQRSCDGVREPARSSKRTAQKVGNKENR